MNYLKLNDPLGDTTVIVAPGVDPEKSGIYVFCIDGIGTYVGQYTNPSRYRGHYSRNVRNLRLGNPYRPSNPHGFRRVHRELAKAIGEKREISLTLLENWEDKSDRNRRERELKNSIGTLND